MAAAAGFGAPFSLSAQNLLQNGSFETLSQSVSADAYTVNFGSLPVNVATGWTFGTSGVNNGYNGIATTSGNVSDFNPTAIQNGSFAAFLQGAGSVSQTFTLSAGQYTLSYYLMGRTGSGGGDGANPVTTSLSGGLVNDVETPGNADINNASDWTLYTDTFTVLSPGSYTLQFLGNDPYGVSGDHTTFVDNVAVQAVPEPSCLALLAVGLVGFGVARPTGWLRRFAQ